MIFVKGTRILFFKFIFLIYNLLLDLELLFVLTNFGDNISVSVWSCKGKVHHIIVVLEFVLKLKCVIVKHLFLFKRLFALLKQSILIRACQGVGINELLFGVDHIFLVHCFFHPVFLVTVGSPCSDIFLAAVHFGFDVLEPLGPQTGPLLVELLFVLRVGFLEEVCVELRVVPVGVLVVLLRSRGRLVLLRHCWLVQVLVAHAVQLLALAGVDGFLRLYHNSLHTVVLLVAVAPRQPWLGKVHDFEQVFLATLGVGHFVIEPLLVSLGVGVHLHVQIVLHATNHFRLQEVAALENGVEQKNVSVVLFGKTFVLLTDAFKVLFEFFGQVLPLALSQGMGHACLVLLLQPETD